MVFDINGKEIKAGDIIKVSGAYSKNDNGLHFVEHGRNGKEIFITKIKKNGEISKAKYASKFFPLISFSNNKKYCELADAHNKKNAKVEIVYNIDNTHCIEFFANELNGYEKDLRKYFAYYGEDSENYKRTSDTIDQYKIIIDRMKKTRENSGFKNKDVVKVRCEWSESDIFETGKLYNFKDFDEMITKADFEYCKKGKEQIEKYGSIDAVYDAFDNGILEDYPRVCYNKTKFTIVINGIDVFTDRYDIGDGNGSFKEFLREFSNGYVGLRQLFEILDNEEKEQENTYAKEKETTSTPEYTIEESTHTKTNKTIYLVKPTRKLSKEEFAAARKEIIANGGYYSRFTHTFVFNEYPSYLTKEENAEETTPEEQTTETVEPVETVETNTEVIEENSTETVEPVEVIEEHTEEPTEEPTEESEKYNGSFDDNSNFYPTPSKVLDKMTNTIDFRMISNILEPSAGKGNIVEYLENKKGSQYNRRYDYSIDCIEKDTTLQATLRGKGFRLLHDDFLTFNTYKNYDLIIMNPPFSNGCKHLLKAIEMQKNGGAVVCVLNAETIKNPYTNERKHLNRIIEEQTEKGLCTVEFLENAFAAAERSTNVEIAIVKIQFEKAIKESFIIENLHKGNQYQGKEASEFYNVTKSDFIESIIEQYNFELKAGIALIEEYESMKNNILCDFGKDENGKTVQKGGAIITINHNVNSFIKEVRAKYWTALFRNDDFTGKLTENVRRDFFAKIDELKEYDFTLWNIKEIQKQIAENLSKGIDETIIELFDEMSNKHHYHEETSKNIHLFNGWKTNKAWMINNKVILPYDAFEYTYIGNNKAFRPTKWNGVKSKLEEVEKCLNYLDNGKTANVDISEVLKAAEENGETKKIKLKYFDVTFYKKGTTHITFTNTELLKKFNIYGSQRKGWLPPHYGKKSYDKMSQEEKNVVKAFDGSAAEYSKVLNNSKYFIVSNDGSNLLEMY